jgi:UDP-N-acetylglucosamine--N-acetylmuramyl-(pentapeptide) pyrophosphoryl-undecaprenol N-acetylglucosamine transferase
MEQTTATKTVILAAGGTGGHIFPAAALAEVLRARGIDVRLVTDARFHTYEHAGNVLTQIPVHTIRTGNIGGGLLKKLLGVVSIIVGTGQAIGLMRRYRPIAVVGFGGYPSLPTMLAAILTGKRSIVHEQNSVLGRVNRLIATRVSVIATTYINTLKLPAGARRVVHTGNPVRGAVAALANMAYPEFHANGLLRVLVLGGSQGASVFSTVLPAALALVPAELRAHIRLDQQCRTAEIETVRSHYAALGMQVDLAPFFTDVAARLAAAHLVISRAGASSVAELMLAGKPALLVPLPGAMDNHQFYNAQAVEHAGAGWVVSQEQFTAQGLAIKLETLLRAPERLNDCARAMRQLAVIGAADKLADVVLA